MQKVGLRKNKRRGGKKKKDEDKTETQVRREQKDWGSNYLPARELFYSICVTSSLVYGTFLRYTVSTVRAHFSLSPNCFVLILIYRNSVFLPFTLILPCAQLAVFLIAHMGFSPQMVFAHVYTFPNIMLTEFAIQRIT